MVRIDPGSFGGAEGNRTPDLVIANDALSRLSYGPDWTYGIEPYWQSRQRSQSASDHLLIIQLVYTCARNRLERTMNAILALILNILWLYTLVIFAMVIMSWLIAFNVVNLHNHFVAQLWLVLNRLTEPLLAPIRRFIPSIGGLDLSPIILLLAVYFLQTLIARDLAPRLLGG